MKTTNVRPFTMLGLAALSLTAAAVVVMVLVWGHSGSQTAQAVGPEMSLGAQGNVDCDGDTLPDTKPDNVVDKPTKCFALFNPGDPKAAEFQITVNANAIPAGGYGGFGSEVFFGGLTYNKKAACEDEVVWPGPVVLCARSWGPAGQVSHGAATAFAPPLPKSNFTGTLVKLDVHCSDQGTFKVTLTVAPSSPFGAVYIDLEGNLVDVKTVGTQDVPGLGVVPVADTLLINCVEGLPLATRTPTPTATPPATATPTPTPLPPQVNITNIGQYALPKTCFFVFDEFQNPRFEVCDNDFQGAPDSHPVCVPDGVCEDEDPAQGQIRVTVSAGDYSVVESKPPYNHTGDPSKLPCAATAGKCELTFVNQPNNMPWFPWDVDGNNAVTVADIFDVASHFGDTK